MRIIFGMILGALLLFCGVYIHDSMQTSSAADGQPQANRNLVNWDVAAENWKALKARAHEEWDKIASR